MPHYEALRHIFASKCFIAAVYAPHLCFITNLSSHIPASFPIQKQIIHAYFLHLSQTLVCLLDKPNCFRAFDSPQFLPRPPEFVAVK
jgi:hypothetical protein